MATQAKTAFENIERLRVETLLRMELLKLIQLEAQTRSVCGEISILRARYAKILGEVMPPSIDRLKRDLLS